MADSIKDIEGIGAAYQEKLNAVDIQTTDDLLRRCGSKKGREGVAAESGISEKLILEWTNLADLMRISGVGEQYADLLEEAGVDTVKELATRSAENLTKKMEEVNTAKNLVNRTPSLTVVEGWINEASRLDPMVSH